MIVRVSEAHVRPERLDAFLDRLHDLVGDFPRRYDGLLSHETLVDTADPTRVVYLSRWTDEAALVAYAGERWAVDPVTFPDEADYLLAPLALRHFAVR